MTNHLFNFTISVRGPDEATAWRRLRQAVALETPEELAKRVVVDEVVGWLYPAEILAEDLGPEQIRERIRVHEPSRTAWRRWVSRMRRGRRVKRAIRVAA